jgi:sugar phosphate isomerase/epimerase
MGTTRTGGFAVGFRRGWSEWQQDLDALVAWAVEAGMSAIDLGADGAESGQVAIEAGLRIGSVDLADASGMIASKPARRREAIEKNTGQAEACSAALGPTNLFGVMIPGNPERERRENFGYMVESYGELAGALEKSDCRFVIEGWPGPGALCCTPETLRAFFDACPSPALGINYDPSHLIRMGIDPLRFLREFVDRVYHVHGKDTELLSEGLYECGNLQPATFAEAVGFGEHCWRYAIPGHGVTRWTTVFRILSEAGYSGCVSVELEDANFNGTEEGEKRGLAAGARFLESC